MGYPTARPAVAHQHLLSLKHVFFFFFYHFEYLRLQQFERGSRAFSYVGGDLK